MSYYSDYQYQKLPIKHTTKTNKNLYESIAHCQFKEAILYPTAAKEKRRTSVKYAVT